MTIATPLRTYWCIASGCRELTAGHYCEAHRVDCADCGEEYEAADLHDGVCRDCARAACADEIETYVEAVCVCGGHS